MKKTLALLLALVLVLSLCACGAEKAPGQQEKPAESFEPDTEPVEEVSRFADTKWIGLYTGDTLQLNSDGSMVWNDGEGTWEEDGKTLNLSYVSADGKTTERAVDILENGSVLKTKKNATVNGDAKSNFVVQELYPEDTLETVKADVVKSLEDTVSTDIMDITVHNAQLAFYAAGRSVSTSSGLVVNASEACSPAEGGFFESSKGRCLICLDFTLKNTDRGSLDTDGALSFTILQNGNHAAARGYALNEKDGSPFRAIVFDRAIVEENSTTGSYRPADTSNLLLWSGEFVRAKVVCVVGFEPEDLSAPFDLVVNAKNSDGEMEHFIYHIQ